MGFIKVFKQSCYFTQIRKVDCEPFICDLGRGHRFTSPRQRNVSTPGERAGVARYSPPEAFNPSEKVSFARDVWSLACILTEILTGEMIWGDCNDDTQIMCRLRERDNVEPELLDKVENEYLREELRRCFTKNKDNRPQASDLTSAFKGFTMGKTMTNVCPLSPPPKKKNEQVPYAYA